MDRQVVVERESRRGFPCWAFLASAALAFVLSGSTSCRSPDSKKAPLQPALAKPGTQPKAEPLPPKPAVQGWRTLAWGDDFETVKRKLAEDGVLRCPKPSGPTVSKGRKLHTQNCRSTPRDPSGIRLASLLYLNGALQRVVVEYRMRPGSAAIDNLQHALSERYCQIDGSLDSAISQAKQGNSGQHSQLGFACEMTRGSVFLRIKNAIEDSDVAVFISSNEYDAFLKENEFAKSF